MQGNRPADRVVGAKAPLTVLDIEGVVEQSPPQNHVLAGQIRVDLVEGPL